MVPLEQAGQLETAAILSFLTAALRFLALWGDFFCAVKCSSNIVAE
jgi:hypothetical protein